MINAHNVGFHKKYTGLAIILCILNYTEMSSARTMQACINALQSPRVDFNTEKQIEALIDSLKCKTKRNLTTTIEHNIAG
ncbi:hypothetical protein TDB9533_02632 [Thalassocella blandensis]|nr:hypothetical protein TDB9533_02632 [Thalassocella blandensis]